MLRSVKHATLVKLFDTAARTVIITCYFLIIMDTEVFFGGFYNLFYFLDLHQILFFLLKTSHWFFLGMQLYPLLLFGRSINNLNFEDQPGYVRCNCRLQSLEHHVG